MMNMFASAFALDRLIKTKVFCCARVACPPGPMAMEWDLAPMQWPCEPCPEVDEGGNPREWITFVPDGDYSTHGGAIYAIRPPAWITCAANRM